MSRSRKLTRRKRLFNEMKKTFDHVEFAENDVEKLCHDMEKIWNDASKVLGDLRFDTKLAHKRVRKNFDNAKKTVKQGENNSSQKEEKKASVNKELAKKYWNKNKRKDDPHPKHDVDFRGESFRDYVANLEEENKRLKTQLVDKVEQRKTVDAIANFCLRFVAWTCVVLLVGLVVFGMVFLFL